MKAIILTVTSGEGHNNIARTITAEMAKHDVECKTIDIFAHNKFEYKFNNLGYLFVCSHFPKTYDYFWKKLKFRNSNKRYTGIAQREVEKVADFVRQGLTNEPFDFFICVHPYTAILCDFWKRNGYFCDKKAFSILPDILPHPLWESGVKCDYIITPTFHSAEQLAGKGYLPEQILVEGFPVAEKFTKAPDKGETRKKLELADKFTVMIVSGGYGIGKNQKVVKQLLKSDVQILCVNGRNKDSFEKTQKIVQKHPECIIKNYGFVNNMDELMSAADVIVSRGGGGSVFEALSKRLPMIIREKSIINERENAEILEKIGIAVRLKKLSDLAIIVNDFKNHPEKTEKIRALCDDFTKRRCVKDVCQTILTHI